MHFLGIIAVIVVIFVVILYLISPLLSPKPLKVAGCHALVTGGSSGIGKAVAVELVKQGATVTLLARNQARLAEAKAFVETHIRDPSKQKVCCISVDLCKDFKAVENAVRQAEELVGPVDFLINSAGTSCPGRFDEIAIQEFKNLMDMNYISAVHATRAVLPGMKKQGQGRIVFLSSQAGQLGLYGFTAYSASKFALRGLAEALQMEVKPFNIYVTLAFPPDTDTPGFAEELKQKPLETKLISETAGLFPPEYVARTIIKDAVTGKFSCWIGLDGWMLERLCCGMSPASSLIDVIQQVFLMGVFRVVSLFYLMSFDGIVKKCKLEREKEIKGDKSD